SGGPYGGAIRWFAASASRVFYAATAGGVFKSDDGGMSWRDISHGLRDVRIIAAQPPAAYAVAGNRIYKTIDDAAWTDITPPVPVEFTPTGLVVDPQNANTVFVASACIPDWISAYYTAAAGVYKSTNGGQSWSRTVNGIGGFGVCARELSLDPAAPSPLFLPALFVNLHSLAGGASWQPRVTLLPQPE